MYNQTLNNGGTVTRKKVANASSVEEKWNAWEATKVWGTKDYDQFKKIPGNRELYAPHLLRLKQSIAKKDLLKYNPGMVTKDKYLLDGQHRLQDARELDKPFYFIIVEDMDIEGLMETILLNANLREWQRKNYLESHIALGNKNYIILQDFAQEYRLSPAICNMLLADNYNHRGEMLQDFYDGKFEVVNLAKAERVASLISEVRGYSPDYSWAARDCIRALAVIEEKGYAKKLVDQLHKYNQVVTKRVSKMDYLRQFENILKAGEANKGLDLTK